jgi:hypothetical protein
MLSFMNKRKFFFLRYKLFLVIYIPSRAESILHINQAQVAIFTPKDDVFSQFKAILRSLNPVSKHILQTLFSHHVTVIYFLLF